MIGRRKFLAALTAFCASSVRAQAPARTDKPARVGILSETTSAKFEAQEKVFVDAMRGMGWEEGRNILYDRVYGDDDESRLTTLTAALVTRNPNLIFVVPNPSAKAASDKTRTIPIVFSASSAPVDRGLVRSLAHPGGNVTGVVNIAGELGGKRLQLVKEALPKTTRVTVLLEPAFASTGDRELDLIEKAAASLRVTVIPVKVNDVGELDAALASLMKNRSEVLLTTVSTVIFYGRKRVLEAAAKLRIPLIAHRTDFVEEGALLSYGSSLYDQIRRATQIVDKILKGAKPADIPVERPTKFELAVNMKTAKALGIVIPQSVLLRADRLIE